MTSAIVRTHYRYRRPPWKRKPNPAALATPTVVTVRRRKHASLAQVPEMTPEEHKRRGDAADAMFQEMKRVIAAKIVKDRT